MDSGVFWELKANDVSHVISWHDVSIPETGNYRVWVHALGTELLRDFLDQSKNRLSVRMQFNIAGVEVQSLGKSFPVVSNAEKVARLGVANLQKDAPTQAIKGSLFRGLPFSKIEDAHNKCLQACRAKIEEELSKPLRIAKSDTVPTVTLKAGRSGSVIERKFHNALEIASTKADSIAIAKMYSEFYIAGTSNIVKKICIDLGVESKNVYAALRVARSQGWLSASGKGKSGGRLTKEGELAFKDLHGELTLTRWLSRSKGEFK
jgi:hypothetical protein